MKSPALPSLVLLACVACGGKQAAQPAQSPTKVDLKPTLGPFTLGMPGSALPELARPPPPEFQVSGGFVHPKDLTSYAGGRHKVSLFLNPKPTVTWIAIEMEPPGCDAGLKQMKADFGEPTRTKKVIRPGGKNEEVTVHFWNGTKTGGTFEIDRLGCVANVMDLENYGAALRQYGEN